MIANTLVTSEKQKTAKFCYNLRVSRLSRLGRYSRADCRCRLTQVVELRVAATLLANHLRLSLGPELPTLKHVMDAYFGAQSTHTNADFLIERRRRLAIMLSIVEDLFGEQKEGNSWEDVYSSLGGMDEKSFKQKFHPTFEIDAERLKLYSRAKHAVRQPFFSRLTRRLNERMCSMRKREECTNTVASSRTEIRIWDRSWAT